MANVHGNRAHPGLGMAKVHSNRAHPRLGMAKVHGDRAHPGLGKAKVHGNLSEASAARLFASPHKPAQHPCMPSCALRVRRALGATAQAGS
eukprot:8796392-Alexandrium_andersonii.AAC.1